MKIKNSFGTKFSGTIDKMTAVNRNGVNFLRTHVIPHNPRSPVQQRNRNHFAEGVERWRSLRESQRRFYNWIAKRTSGYNLFLSKWMESHSRATRAGSFCARARHHCSSARSRIYSRSP